MDSKEFGLVAADQLFQLKHIHYGLWDKGAKPEFAQMPVAQEKHTKYLVDHIAKEVKDKNKEKLIDVGCGIGSVLVRLLSEGYRADGVVPSPWMAKKAREEIAKTKCKEKGVVYESTLEDFEMKPEAEKYALAFFSESFQYVNMDEAFIKLKSCLVEGGKIIIFDFFSKDGVAGKSPLGGGHSLKKFYSAVKAAGLDIEADIDLTQNFSPNMELVSDILANRLLPFCDTLDQFLSARYPFLYKLLKFFARKRLKKLKFKYSKERNGKNFEKYKSYRLIKLKFR